jgi:uncharacterized membrane protein
MRKSEIVALGIIVLSFALAIYFYPQMPEKVASHWNAQGQVDDYMSRFWGLFLMPMISAILLLFFILIPKIDPLKENIEKFRRYYDGFVVLMLAFLFYIFLLALLWNIGWRFNMTQAIAPSFGVLFYYLGVLLENARRNWFIGIRTPWTLSSEVVWDRTHRVGGRLFKAAGVIALLGFLLPGFAIYLVVVPVVLAAFYAIVYSYFEYQFHEKS